MPNNPTEATPTDINAITQTASVRTIKTSDAMGVASSDTAQTFGTLQSFSAGLSASGGTFSGSIALQNAEYIQNTTNGRVDLMPAPSSATAYGMYFDLTSWTYGIKMGTIKSSDGVLNNGNFLWEAPMSIGNNVQFNLGSDGQHNLSRTTTGLDTTQFSVNCTTGTNSGAFAIVDAYGQGYNNRSPVTAHTNPNLYVYRAGSANANDFIRVEHDGTNGNIISGGTSGILIQPGSGVLGISGDTISVSTQKTPASATATGTKGNIVHDTNYIYVCTATNTWKRALISTW